MKYYVYVLKSLVNDSFYKGFTANLENRLAEHNSGKSNYSSRYKPWEIVYFEEVNSLEDAILREKYFKSAAGRRFLKTKILRPFGCDGSPSD